MHTPKSNQTVSLARDIQRQEKQTQVKVPISISRGNFTKVEGDKQNLFECGNRWACNFCPCNSL